jgi:hypothetical protein
MSMSVRADDATAVSANPRVRVGQAISDYVRSTREPLYNLVFLLPLVVIYEVATIFVTGVSPAHELVAQRIIRVTLGWIGVEGSWLAGVLLLATLLVWHLRTQRSWLVRPYVPLLMIVESAVLVLPLIVLHSLMLQIGGGGNNFRARLLQTFGAGLYEELLFRLYLVGGLMLLAHQLRVRGPTVSVAIILIGGAVFAWCHFAPIGADAFGWPAFLHRMAAGAYLSFVFLRRGLGVAVGCHVLHNIILLMQSAAKATPAAV